MVIEKNISGSVVMVCGRCKAKNLIPLIEELLVTEENARCYHCGINMITDEQIWVDNRSDFEKPKV